MPETDGELDLLTAAELAKMLGVTERTLRTMRSNGHVPEPVRATKQLRWVRWKIVRWIEQGDKQNLRKTQIPTGKKRKKAEESGK